MAFTNFTDALMNAKRKMALAGSRLTDKVASGISRGFAENQDERMARQKMLNLQKQELEDRKLMQTKQLEHERSIEAARLEEEKTQRKEMMRAANQARKDAKKKARRGAIGGGIGGAAGAIIGGIVGGPAGALVGLGGGGSIGSMFGDSYICNQVERFCGLTDTDKETLKDFRKYALDKHEKVTRWYLENGPVIIGHINATELEDASDLYDKLDDEMINPVIDLFQAGNPEEAFVLYHFWVEKLIKKYSPFLLNSFKEASEATEESEVSNG